ncbi:Alpha/Beta hydrolase protein [Aspergillus pseudoustus]|uniref:Dipeptidyl-peptidase V n=1 Tax=Aspergillus pseudoustus TaxID=1810923 RepID=A0ABR4IUD5_9EURO
MPSQNPTLAALPSLLLPSDISISPDGTQALYSLSTFSKTSKHATSSLWIADIGKDHSARQITSGLFRDEKPRWSPNGRYIAFVSDRAGRGVKKGVYLLPIGGFGEAFDVTGGEGDVKEGTGFEWSADGRFIAFISEVNGSCSDHVEEFGSDEPIVFGGEDAEGSSNARLRLIDVERKIVSTLSQPDENVDLFSFSPQTNEIAYTVSDPDSSLSQLSSTRINIVDADRGSASRRNFINPKSPITSLVWSQADKLHFIARPTPPYTSLSVYEARIRSKQFGSYFGWDGEALSLHKTRDSVVARVQNAHSEDAHALGVQSVAWPFPSFFTSEFEISSFDAFRHSGSSDDFTLVVARSSPSVANEVYSVTCKQGGGYGYVKLSSHNARFDGFRSKRISATGADGWECDGWLFTPKPVTITRRLPPTVVLVQSHPTLPSFSMGPHLDVAHLTAAGYAVLCPTLRPTPGSASTSGTGIGDRYADVIAILKKAVAQGLVDESRVTISGWSDGGFLSSLAVIRNEFSFRAVVCGGGVVDWEFVNANSDPFWPAPDVPDFSPRKNVGLGRGRELVRETDVGGSKNKIEKRETPLLILHGRDDDIVPVSGPLAFWREKQRWNGPVQMVLYPRERHVIRDNKHLVDLWTRVLQFYDRYLD